MGETYILSRPWLVASVWAFLYIGDHCLTIWGAKLFRKQPFTEIEGSYELNPQHQDDIDKLRLIGWRFVMWLVLVAALLLLMGSVEHPQFLYGLFAGYFIFPQFYVWMRHVDNISTYRRIIGPDPGLEGHLRSTKRASYRRSSVQCATFGVFAVCIFVLDGSYLALGGAACLFELAIQHLVLASHARPEAALAQEENKDQAATT